MLTKIPVMKNYFVFDSKHITQFLYQYGWKELHEQTLNRIEIISSIFKKYYEDNDIISNLEIDERVAGTLAAFGQEFVYGIYSKLNDSKGLKNFDSFVTAFKETIPETAELLQPKHYISLFLEYFYAMIIKGVDK